MNLRDVTVSSVKEAREDGEYVSEVKLKGERIGWVRQIGKHPNVTGFEAWLDGSNARVNHRSVGQAGTSRGAAQIVKREYLRAEMEKKRADTSEPGIGQWSEVLDSMGSEFGPDKADEIDDRVS